MAETAGRAMVVGVSVVLVLAVALFGVIFVESRRENTVPGQVVVVGPQGTHGSGPVAHPDAGLAFRRSAARICRQELASIIKAPSFEAALAASRSMRIRLSALNPPASERAAFARWMSDLRGTESAALRGDVPMVDRYDAMARQEIQTLGLETACVHRVA
jgi:hypothetical protein